jgi:hypothetical protein
LSRTALGCVALLLVASGVHCSSADSSGDWSTNGDPDSGVYGDTGGGNLHDSSGHPSGDDGSQGGSDSSMNMSDGFTVAPDTGGMTGDGSTGDDTSDPPDTGTPPPTEGGPPPPPCKRGIATGTTPSANLAPSQTNPGVVWWYNWGSNGSSSPLEFVPMIWGQKNLNNSIPGDSKYVLGFNEPNFKAQSNLTPPQASADWPAVQGKAQALNIPTVAPGLNFCGSASDPSQCSDPSITDPYTWLKDFLADCNGCEIDHIAVHWYNCDLQSLQAYIEGNTSSGGNLEGFAQFNKPIWLTEFSCDGSHSVADQQAYMQAAIPYLERSTIVYRYSWFSADPIPNAVLQNQDGSLTDLGNTYVSLPAACRP